MFSGLRLHHSTEAALVKEKKVLNDINLNSDVSKFWYYWISVRHSTQLTIKYCSTDWKSG